MIYRNLEDISEGDLRALIDAARPEDAQIEYKLVLPGLTNDDKKEFLADAVSFANKAGGDLIFGLDEDRDGNNKATGLPRAIAPIVDNADTAIRRLDSLIQDGIAPRLTSYRIRSVPVSGGFVLIARIDRSYAGPHQIAFQGSGRFYSRNSAGKYPMDVHEIGRAFRNLADVPAALKRRHQERVDSILVHAPVQLVAGGKVILHVFSVPGFVNGVTVDVRQMATQREALRPMRQAAPHSERFNLDGLLATGPSTGDGRQIAYVQMFRDGTIESTAATLIDRTGNEHNQYIPIVNLEDEVISACSRFARVEHALGLGLPLSIHLSISGAKGKLIPAGAYPMHDAPPIDRDLLVLPHVLINDHGVSMPDALRPIFDALWQSAGHERALSYSDDGKFSRG